MARIIPARKKLSHCPDPSSNVRIESTSSLPFVLCDLRALLERYGYVVISGLPATIESLRETLPFFGCVQNHEFAKTGDGIVEIFHARPNGLGANPTVPVRSFTKEDFLPHTDGAPLDHAIMMGGTIHHAAPPAFLLLQVVFPSRHGGETILVDTEPAFADLKMWEPELFSLCFRRCLTFAWDNLLSPPLALLQETHGRCRVRLNQRRKFLSTEAVALEPFIQNELQGERYQIGLKLRAGDILIIDNFRMLHGRTALRSRGGSANPSGVYRFHRRVWIHDQGSLLHSTHFGNGGSFTNPGVLQNYLPIGGCSQQPLAMALEPGIRL